MCAVKQIDNKHMHALAYINIPIVIKVDLLTSLEHVCTHMRAHTVKRVGSFKDKQ